MHFTYSEKDLSPDLRQGDILRRTPEIETILKDAHPHYFRKAENKYFIVLTQDCDLVRREGMPCQARYIELAAVRSIKAVISRQIDVLRDNSFELPVCTTKNRARLVNFMSRLLNNNEPEYFYLHKESQRGFPEDCCAFLALSIAVKADFHYEVCVKAKILELQDSFRAKLGWLIGRLYSPVGTEEWSAEKLQEEIEQKIESSAYWIEEKQQRSLRKLVKKWRSDNPGEAVTAGVMKGLAGEIPRRQEEVIENTLRILREGNHLPPEAEKRVSNQLRNDPQLSSLLKS